MRKTKARLTDTGVLINKQDVNIKVLKWVVDKIGEELVIQPTACTYLLERGSVKVIDENDRELNLNELILRFSKKDMFFISKYIVFKELADKGYILHEPFEREPILFASEKITKEPEYIIYVIEEGFSINIDKIYFFLTKYLKKAETKPKFILAIVERRGGVTFYSAELFKGVKNVEN